MRSSERKRVRNKPLDTLCKTNIAKAERFILSGDLDTAKKAVVWHKLSQIFVIYYNIADSPKHKFLAERRHHLK